MRMVAKHAWRAVSSFSGKAAMLAFALASLNAFAAPTKDATQAKPTVVLVHGAFAESSSWNGVAGGLLREGYHVVAVANPLRGVKSDAAYVGSVLDSVQGPVILVGHSYGGSVITAAANGKSNVKALVFVAAFAPDQGESAASIGAKFPTGTLGAALAPPVTLADGNKDLYIDQGKFHAQFAADVPAKDAALMAATQRPIVASALEEAAGTPAWKTIPNWFIYGSLDKNIPPDAIAFMAKRANARKVIEIKGASHVVMVSHPDAVVKIIDEAAAGAMK